jgi:hypothetical protein
VSEPPGSHTQRRQDAHHGVPEHPPDGDTSLEQILQRRVPLRVRLIQGLGLLILGALAAGLLRQTVLTTPGGSGGVVPTPSPTVVALGPVLVLSNLSYGAVTLNGVALPGSLPLVTRFRRGPNILTLSALPFRPRICHIQWPTLQSSDGCEIDTGVGPPHSVGGQMMTPAVTVYLSFGSTDLPSSVETRALAAVTKALQAMPLRITVPGGDYLATGVDGQGHILSLQATTPVQADLLVTVSAFDGGESFCDDPGCVSLRDSATGRGITRPSWVVDAEIRVEWDFTVNNSHVVHSTVYSYYLPSSLLLTYDPQTEWQVDLSNTEQVNGFGLSGALALATCELGASLLSTLTNPLLTTAQQPEYQVATVDNNGIGGCTLQLTRTGGTGVTGTDGTNAGSFVWRFGVLLAADAEAHALLPYLPLAPSSELAAVDASSPASPFPYREPAS